MQCSPKWSRCRRKAPHDVLVTSPSSPTPQKAFVPASSRCPSPGRKGDLCWESPACSETPHCTGPPLNESFPQSAAPGQHPTPKGPLHSLAIRFPGRVTDAQPPWLRPPRKTYVLVDQHDGYILPPPRKAVKRILDRRRFRLGIDDEVILLRVGGVGDVLGGRESEHFGAGGEKRRNIRPRLRAGRQSRCPRAKAARDQRSDGR